LNKIAHTYFFAQINCSMAKACHLVRNRYDQHVVMTLHLHIAW
jgi:hypothetical protein